MKYQTVLLATVLSTVAWADFYDARVDALVAKMTREEKLMQLTQHFAFSTNDAAKGSADLTRKGLGSIIWGVQDPEARNALQRIAMKESRLGIPLLFCNDMIHGDCYTFPIALGLACTFEPALVERCQAFAARESRAEGVDLAFAPMCDLARDPRWGRVAETCGEDPYLSSLMNAAQVRGFQGTDPSAPDRVAACLKHYCGYSAVTGGRDYNDSEITPWTLQNMHLPSFRAGVAAGALSVMSSFNTYDGVPAVMNRFLLTDVLRKQLGFAGFVVSDWGAVGEAASWGVAKDAADAARRSLEAGNDIDMCSGSYRQMPDDVALDAAVRRVLRVKFWMGLFDRPYCDAVKFEEVRKGTDSEARFLGLEAAEKSCVLLKNDGVLPLKAKKVAVIGPMGEDTDSVLGCWRARGCTPARESLVTALRRVLGDAEVTYVKGSSQNTERATRTLQDGTVVPDDSLPETDRAFDTDAAFDAAKAADVVILAVSEFHWMTGENGSRATLDLTGRQNELASAVLAAGKPVVAVVFSGRPLVLPEIWEKAAAVLYAWQPGRDGPTAIAELLAGVRSPSGRLSMSVPKSLGEVPAFYNRPHTGRWMSGEYRDVKKPGAKYPFGYGLTYSRAEYGKVCIEGNRAKCAVKNVGTRAMIETVQLYIHARVSPQGWRPVRELRGFQRVALNPGEAAEVAFDLTPRVFGYWTREGAFSCDLGEYDVFISPDSGDACKEGATYAIISTQF